MSNFNWSGHAVDHAKNARIHGLSHKKQLLHPCTCLLASLSLSLSLSQSSSHLSDEHFLSLSASPVQMRPRHQEQARHPSDSGQERPVQGTPEEDGYEAQLFLRPTQDQGVQVRRPQPAVEPAATASTTAATAAAAAPRTGRKEKRGELAQVIKIRLLHTDQLAPSPWGNSPFD